MVARAGCLWFLVAIGGVGDSDLYRHFWLQTWYPDSTDQISRVRVASAHSGVFYLDVTDPATMVRFPARLLKDPRNDKNVEATVQIIKVL